jgi:L-malate glycosyltransferase
MKSKKVLFLNPYPENAAPSQRLKFEQYYPHFRAAGWQVDTSSFISQAFWKIIYGPGRLPAKAWYTLMGYCKRVGDLLSIRRYDVVYIHLWATPLGPPVFEWLFSKLAKKVIYDIDDLVYLGDVKSKAHPVVNLLKGRKKPIFLMKHSDHVITCTPYLDKFVRQFNQQTTDISSTIDTDRYKPKAGYTFQGKPVIGWSGSHSTSKYLHLLDDVLQELSHEIPFKLLVMGDPHFSIPGVDVEAIAWQDSYEVDTIRRFDIGLYPLPNEEWVLGKSGLKALQYMALGVPTIATAIGTIHRIIKNGENGFLVATPAEWKQAMAELLGDESLRKKLGSNSVQTVEENYSINVTQHTYLNILNRVAGKE